jgi:hypothetical protein
VTFEEKEDRQMARVCRLSLLETRNDAQACDLPRRTTMEFHDLPADTGTPGDKEPDLNPGPDQVPQ